MKKAAVIICGVLLFLIVLYFLQTFVRQRVIQDFTATDSITTHVPSPTPYEKVAPLRPEKTSEFVTYWTMGQGIESDSQELIYFGVSAGRDGINKEEAGYTKLSQFVDQAGQDKKKHLVLRMLDQEISSDVLGSRALQETLIKESLDIAKENGFDGIVLDLEYKSLPFESVIKDINAFVSRFYTRSKANDLNFSVLMYGDTFYRVRPFDVAYIGKNSDEVMIMAYDFHKSGGNPGPNFPLTGSEKYGYDFHEMISDFLRVVPAEKLTVVFGMFGYDWQTAPKSGGSAGPGKALSLAQIEDRFIGDCKFSQCNIKRDVVSGETVVTYTDQDGNRHVVWFEDNSSVKEKQKFLKERGINSFSYWAYSFY